MQCAGCIATSTGSTSCTRRLHGVVKVFTGWGHHQGLCRTTTASGLETRTLTPHHRWGGGGKGCATQEGIDLPHTAASPTQLLNKPCTPWCVTVPEEVVGSAVTGRLQQYRRGTGQRQGSNHRFGNRPPLLAVGRTHALCEECWSVIIMRSIGNYSHQSETQPKGFRGGPSSY